MQKDKVLNLIGLAQKAGKVVSGEFMTEKAVKRRSCIGYLSGGCFGKYAKEIPEHV